MELVLVDLARVVDVEVLERPHERAPARAVLPRNDVAQAGTTFSSSVAFISFASTNESNSRYEIVPSPSTSNRRMSSWISRSLRLKTTHGRHARRNSIPLMRPSPFASI